MKRNMGSADRIIRLIVGIATLLISILVTSGAADIVLYVITAIMIITSITGICPRRSTRSSAHRSKRVDHEEQPVVRPDA